MGLNIYLRTNRGDALEENTVQADGAQLYSLMQEQHFPSFRVRIEPLLHLATINSVIVVGSTATGKTTLERAIRAADIHNVSVPKKVITRELRPDDNLEEVIPTKAEEFSTMADTDQMGLYWERPMDGGKVESYGRLKPEPGTTPRIELKTFATFPMES